MDLFHSIFKFFITKDYSFASKFIGLIIFLTFVLVIDNFLGFSFYYSNNQKITQLKNIESLKKECSTNTILLNTLSETETQILNRKNIFDNFIDLFSREPFDEINKLSNKGTKSENNSEDTSTQNDSINSTWKFPINLVLNNQRDSISKDTLIGNIVIQKQNTKNYSTANKKQSNLQCYNKKIVVNTNTINNRSRSKVWHTITSSYLFILVLIILPIVPFTQKKFNWSLLLGILILMIIDAGFIWLFQSVLGLIPVIFNKPWINYSLNVFINTIIIFMIILISDKINNKDSFRVNP